MQPMKTCIRKVVELFCFRNYRYGIIRDLVGVLGSIVTLAKGRGPDRTTLAKKMAQSQTNLRENSKNSGAFGVGWLLLANPGRPHPS